MNRVFQGDSLTVLKTLDGHSVQTCVTSPPYFGLRDYGVDGQIGLEETPEQYVQKLVEVFREVRRVLRDDGTLWLNLGDSYAGSGKGRNGDGSANVDQNSKQATSKGTTEGKLVKTDLGILKPKDLIGIPWRVAFALQADGWYLRQDIIWHKPNPMPESVTDRCTKAHEYIFLLSKSPTYYYDNEAVKEPSIYGAKGSEFHTGKTGIHQLGRSSSIPRDKRAGQGRIAYEGKRTQDTTGKNGQESFVSIAEKRNRRSVWTVTTKPYKGAHFATFPPDLIEPCVLAGAPEDGVVLDPFFGSGTTGAVATKHGRQYIGIELNPAYISLSDARLATVQPLLVK